MPKNKKSSDLFSRFVNWFSSVGSDTEPTNRIEGSQDFFSKIMNKISN